MRPCVLHIVVAGDVGGAERVVTDLAGGRTHARHAIAVITPNPALTDFLRRCEAPLHIRRVTSDGGTALLWRTFGPADAAWLGEIIRTERPTVVHLHTFASQAIGTRVARAAGLPVVRTEHSSRVYRNLGCWPMSRWSLRRTDSIVAVSDYVAGLVKTRAPWAATRVRVIHNGVDLPAVPSDDPPDGPFRLALVARLEPRKGVDLALAALRHVPRAHLDVVGDGPSRAALERLALQYGLRPRVVFHGWREDPGPLVRRAHAALSTSKDEALSLSLLESMALGRPALAVPIGGLPEIVRPGVTGWLATARSEAALADALEDISRDVAAARRLGRRARTFVQEHFSLTGMRDAYDDVYARASHIGTAS